MLLPRHPLTALCSLNSSSFVICVSYMAYSVCPAHRNKQREPLIIFL
uniref:Uncharacterized protein n=1 Tax=Arundo donax TaxID=35708 RepID=A0A0A8Z5E6_ARUDO